jgi:hypothetical protein
MNKELPSIRIVSGERHLLVDAAVRILKDHPAVVDTGVFTYAGVLYQRLGNSQRRFPAPTMMELLSRVAAWERQTRSRWVLCYPPAILRDLERRAAEWAPAGRIVRTLVAPAYWAEPGVAIDWLMATGWRVQVLWSSTLKSEVLVQMPLRRLGRHTRSIGQASDRSRGPKRRLCVLRRCARPSLLFFQS